MAILILYSRINPAHNKLEYPKKGTNALCFPKITGL